MNVTLYSDGSSRGNPGPGGYGTILEYVDKDGKLYTLELTEGFLETTNNRMELLGVIKGLEALNKPCFVEVISDSKYVTDAFNQHWVENWAKNQWRNSSKQPVKNKDLWIRLLSAMKPHQVSYTWVKGHAGHPQNERCDELATMSADGENLLVDEGYNENEK